MIRYTFIFIFCAVGINLGISQPPTDSLFNALWSSEGKNRIIILHELTYNAWLNYPDSAQQFAKEALEIAQSLGDSAAISKSLRLLGGTHNYKGEYEKALDYNLKALHVATRLQDSSLMNNAANNAGLVYHNLGSNQNALEYLMRALRIKERTNEQYGIEQTLNNIGLIFQEAGNYEQARMYFSRGLEVATKHANKELILYSSNNLGLTCLAENSLDEAHNYFQQSIEMAQQVNNKNWTSVALRGMGEYFSLRNRFDSADYYYEASLQLRRTIKDRLGISEISRLKAMQNLQQKRFEQALNLITKSDSIASVIGAKEAILEGYKLYASLYDSLRNYKKSNQYRAMYMQLLDSTYHQVIARNLALVPSKIQEEESRVALQKSEIALKEQKFINLVYISLLLLILPFFVLLFLYQQRNKKINKTLSRQNAKVESQKEEIETQKEYLELNIRALEKAKNTISQQKEELEKLNLKLADKVDARTSELKKVNETLRVTSLELDNFIYKSSHDIKGPLVRLMGICHVALLEIKDPAALEYFRMLDKASKRLNFIMDELKFISELKDRRLNPTSIDFEATIKQCIEEVKYIENTPNARISMEFHGLTSYESDPTMLRLIIYNILQNIIQFMKSEDVNPKVIHVLIKQEYQEINLVFKASNLRLMNQDLSNFVQSFSEANAQYDKLSIGLYAVKQCVNRLEGAFDLRAKKNDTSFEVVLPLHTVYSE